MKFLLKLLLFSSFIYLFCCADDPCKYTARQGTIDLTSLGRTDGTPAFKDDAGPTDNYMYSYNPCKPFNEASCNSVSGCQISKDGKYSFEIGKQETVQWLPPLPGGVPQIRYTAGLKSLIVDLVCSQGPDRLDAYGEKGGIQNIFYVTLTSKCACWDGCKGSTTTPSPGHKTGGLSGGAIVIIIAVCLLVTYVVATVLYNRFRLNLQGTELIPHRTFWVSLPGLSKDGFLHTYRTVRGQGKGYQKV